MEHWIVKPGKLATCLSWPYFGWTGKSLLFHACSILCMLATCVTWKLDNFLINCYISLIILTCQCWPTWTVCQNEVYLLTTCLSFVSNMHNRKLECTTCSPVIFNSLARTPSLFCYINFKTNFPLNTEQVTPHFVCILIS